MADEVADTGPKSIYIPTDEPSKEPDTIELIVAAEEKGRRQFQFQTALSEILSPYEVALQMKAWDFEGEIKDSKKNPKKEIKMSSPWSWRPGIEQTTDKVFPSREKRFQLQMGYWLDETGRVRPERLVSEGSETWIMPNGSRAGITILPAVSVTLDDKNNIKRISLGHNPDSREDLWHLLKSDGTRDRSLVYLCQELGLNLEHQNFIEVDLTGEKPRIQTWVGNYRDILGRIKDPSQVNALETTGRNKVSEIKMDENWQFQGPKGPVDNDKALKLVSTVLDFLPVKEIPKV